MAKRLFSNHLKPVAQLAVSPVYEESEKFKTSFKYMFTGKREV